MILWLTVLFILIAAGVAITVVVLAAFMRHAQISHHEEEQRHLQRLAQDSAETRHARAEISAHDTAKPSTANPSVASRATPSHRTSQSDSASHRSATGYNDQRMADHRQGLGEADDRDHPPADSEQSPPSESTADAPPPNHESRG